jgi:hypothetical protein
MGKQTSFTNDWIVNEYKQFNVVLCSNWLYHLHLTRNIFLMSPSKSKRIIRCCSAKNDFWRLLTWQLSVNLTEDSSMFRNCFSLSSMIQSSVSEGKEPKRKGWLMSDGLFTNTARKDSFGDQVSPPPFCLHPSISREWTISHSLFDPEPISFCGESDQSGQLWG